MRRTYADRFVSDTVAPSSEPVTPTLELLWQDDASAYAFARMADGSVSAGGLHMGMPAVADVAHAGHGISARRLELDELLALEADPPPGVEQGGTARVAFAVLDVARRSVADGLVHPHLQAADGRWHALWGATLDDHVRAELDAIAHAAPAASAEAFDGDTQAFVDDLYGCAVDELARRALRDAGVGLSVTSPRVAGAAEHFLSGLAAPGPELPAGAGYPALERRVAAWVDGGLARRSRAPWNLGLRLDESDGGPVDGGADAPPVVLELWLEAADDPTLALPASLLTGGADEVFAFLRESDPRRALDLRLATIGPVLADAGIVLDGDPPSQVELDAEQVRAFLRQAMPRLEELGVPVRLPREWVASSSRVRVNLVATGSPATSSGLLTRDAIASFDWRLAIGDVELTEEELRELAAAKEPLIRLRGKWHALRASEVERALRFLDGRSRSAGVVELVRAVAGLETDEAGVELGEIRLDESLDELLAGAGERRFRPLPTPAGMRHDLFPFQERGHGWLRLLGDLRVGGILADDMGLGKTVQAIATLVSEREEAGAEVGPTLVVCPMSVAQQWVREIARFAPGLVVHLHHGPSRLADQAFVDAARSSDVVVTSYDVATRDVELLARVAWDRLLLDEAQDAKNPRTKRHRALRRIPRRRTLALTGTPIENRLGELWAIMDLVNPGLLGSREAFERSLARPIEARGDARALERLRSLVGPFVLRRAKDAPEVDLELPPITITKVECRLTVEQASLYRATVDRWMPRIERHERTFDRRGAVLAMLGQLKQVCNHPELILPTGRPLDGRSGKLERLVEILAGLPPADKALVFTQYPGFDRLAPHLAARLDRDVGLLPRRALGSRTGRARRPVRVGERPHRARRLAPRRRPRAQPPGREPRRPFRSVVEPGSRATGDGPCPPTGPAQAGVRVEPRLHRDPRGADRRAAGLEARARGAGHVRPRRRLARRPRPRCDPLGGRPRPRGDRGGGLTPVQLNDGLPLTVVTEGARIGEGPWARWLASAVVPDESSARAERGRELARAGAVSDVAVGPGSISARVAGSSGGSYAVSLEAAPIPGRIWAEAVRAARGRSILEPGVEGATQSVHLAHLLETEQREPLVPPTRSIRSSCTCPDRERSSVCKHVAAVAFTMADAIDRDPALLLRWRGCAPVEPPASRSGDPWLAGPLPAPRSPRALPPGIVVKRLGRSGIRVGGRDLADVLEPAYRAFAATARRGSEPRPVIIETWSSDSAS